MSTDFDLLTTTIAARYAPGVVTPPAGLPNLRRSTADPPNRLGLLPLVIVFPDSGRFETGQGEKRGGHDFVVRFYYKVATDLPRDMPALRKWLTVLVDQLKASVQLGGAVPTLDVVRAMEWRIRLLPYAGKLYAGIELVCHATTSEGWAATA